MVKNWWFKFDFKVWRTDSDLRRCTLETKGFWLELLCVMHEKDESSVTGSYEELGRLVGCDSAVAARCVVELERTKTADVTICNDEVTVKSRRYEKELNAKKHNKLRVQKHRGNANVTPPQHNRVISKEKEEEKEPTYVGSKKTNDPSSEPNQLGVDGTQPTVIASKRKTACRLPADFSLSDDMIDWANEKCPDVSPAYETEKFIDHWASSSRNATKLDWKAAWRLWMRNAQDWRGEKLNGTNRKPSERDKSATRSVNAERLANALAAGDEQTVRDILGGHGQDHSAGHLAS